MVIRLVKAISTSVTVMKTSIYGEIVPFCYNWQSILGRRRGRPLIRIQSVWATYRCRLFGPRGSEGTWASWRLKSPIVRLFVQLLVQVNNNKNDRSAHYWPLVLGTETISARTAIYCYTDRLNEHTSIRYAGTISKYLAFSISNEYIKKCHQSESNWGKPWIFSNVATVSSFRHNQWVV